MRAFSFAVCEWVADTIISGIGVGGDGIRREAGRKGEEVVAHTGIEPVSPP